MQPISFFFSTASDQMIATWVNSVILTLGLLSLVEILRAFQSASRDSHWIQHFEKETERLGGADPALSRREVIRRLHTELPSDTLVARRLALLEAVDKAGDDPSPDALAAQTVTALDRRAALARWAVNAVVLLGLGGTLIGLSIAVTSGQALLDEALVDETARQSLIQTFTGLKTAFSTTLGGILVAIVLGFFVALLRRRQNQVAERLESMSMQYLYPFYRSSPTDALTRAARHLAAIEERLEGSLVRVIAGLDSAVSNIAEQGASLVTTLAQSLNAIAAETESAAKLQSSHWKRMLAHQRRVLGDPDDAATSLADVTSQLIGAGESLQTLSGDVVKLLPSIESTFAHQIERQAAELNGTMHNYTERIAAAVERQAAGVDQQLRGIGELVPALGDQIATQLSRHETVLTESLSPALDALRTTISDANRVSLSLGTTTDQLRMLTDRVDATLRWSQNVLPRVPAVASPSVSRDADPRDARERAGEPPTPPSETVASVIGAVATDESTIPRSPDTIGFDGRNSRPLTTSQPVTSPPRSTPGLLARLYEKLVR